MPTQITMEFAGSMISNYRRMYKEENEVSFVGTDQDILNIINNGDVAPTGAEQDEWTLESMQEVQDEILSSRKE